MGCWNPIFKSSPFVLEFGTEGLRGNCVINHRWIGSSNFLNCNLDMDEANRWRKSHHISDVTIGSGLLFAQLLKSGWKVKAQLLTKNSQVSAASASMRSFSSMFCQHLVSLKKNVEVFGSVKRHDAKKHFSKPRNKWKNPWNLIQFRLLLRE